MAAPVTVLLQMKIPFDMFERMKEYLAKLEKQHEREFFVAEQRAKTTGDEKYITQHAELRKRGRKVTIHNIARIAMEYGLVIFDDLDKALKLVSSDGMVRGRPRTNG